MYKADIRVGDDEIQIQRERTDRFFCFVQLTNSKIGKLYLPVWGDGRGYTEGRYSLAEELLRSQIPLPFFIFAKTEKGDIQHDFPSYSQSKRFILTSMIAFIGAKMWTDGFSSKNT